jgi:hypothetical protein
MARIVDLALEASEVLRSYLAVHEELLGASIRRWAFIAGLRKPIDFPSLEKRLMDLESKLADIRSELAGLSAQELTKRAKHDIHIELDMYAQKLARAIDKLRVICRRMDEAERTGASRAAYTTEQLNRDKVAYDYAVQEYKRHGLRLNHLLSSY